MPCMHRMPLGPVGLNGMAIYACQGKVLRGCTYMYLTCTHVPYVACVSVCFVYLYLVVYIPEMKSLCIQCSMRSL